MDIVAVPDMNGRFEWRVVVVADCVEWSGMSGSLENRKKEIKQKGGNSFAQKEESDGDDEERTRKGGIDNMFTALGWKMKKSVCEMDKGKGKAKYKII